jgi:sulfur relay (sulfurtransferase) DsrF/TusC family protein
MPMGFTLLWLAKTARYSAFQTYPIYSIHTQIIVLAHEPSLTERNLLNQGLIELVELADEEVFLEKMGKADCMIVL